MPDWRRQWWRQNVNVAVRGVGDSVTVGVVQNFGDTSAIGLTGLADPPKVPEGSGPSVLLAARHELVDFTGRTGYLRFVAEWLEGQAPRSALLLTGPGGQGKTRLALKAARNAQGDGWQVLVARHRLDGGLINPGPEVRLTKKQTSVLVLVDYADRWPDGDVLALFDRPELVSGGSRRRVRVLMLARSSGFWATSLLRTLSNAGIATVARSLRPVDQLEESDQEPPPSRQEIFRVAAERFARELRVDLIEIPEPTELIGDQFELMLAVQMAALVKVLTASEGLPAPLQARLASDPAAASRYLIEREVQNWEEMARRSSHPERINAKLMARAVFVATLTRGLAYDEAEALLGELDLGAHPSVVLDGHRLCFPQLGGERAFEPLYPDRLGEDFLAAMLPGASSGDVGDWAGAVDAAAPAILRKLLYLPGDSRRVPGPGLITVWPHTRAGSVVTELIEVARRWPHVASQYAIPYILPNPFLVLTGGSAALARLCEVPGSDAVLPAVGAALERVIGVGVNLDLDAGAVVIAERLVGLASSQDDDIALARALRTLSIRQMAVGDGAVALDSAEKAASLSRQLAERDGHDPSAGLSGLAAALTNLAMMRAQQGQQNAALEPAQEAVFLYKLLAGPEYLGTGADLSNRGAALANLGKLLSDLGMSQEALGPAQAAVDLYRQIVRQDESANVDLAASLTNLAMLLSDLGRCQDALDPACEAVALYREFADSETGNPRAWLPALAMSLANLGGLLYDLERNEEALTSLQEAGNHYRDVTEPETGNPVYLPALAGTLINLSKCQGALAMRAESMVTAEEALDISQQLANKGTQISAVILINRARALLNLGSCLFEAGNQVKALEDTKEAVALYRQLASPTSGSGAYVPDLVTALSTLSSRLAGSDSEEALQLAYEAIREARRLVQPNLADPGSCQPGLAASLQNVAAILCDRGRFHEALDPAEEAVSVYRQLAAVGSRRLSVYLADLAASLTIVSDCRYRLRGIEDALKPAQEAVDIYRSLDARKTHQPPLLLSPAYAAACHHLGAILVELGRPEEASDPIQEAIRVRSLLADPDSAPQVPRAIARFAALASSWDCLGMIHYQLNRMEEAVQSVQKAISLRRKLASSPSGDTVAWMPDLAVSLINLAAIMSGSGQIEEALDPSREVVSIYRDLMAASHNPSYYLPDLAEALRNYSERLHAVGQTASAVGAATEATRIYRGLVGSGRSSGSSPHLPALAASLTMEALISQDHDLAAAFSALNEAVRCWAMLATHSPERYASCHLSADTALAVLRNRLDGQQPITRQASQAPQGKQHPRKRPVAARAVGIDLGTTNSVVAVLEGGEPVIIATAEGTRTTPSVVAFAENGEVQVGEVAKRQAIVNVNRTILSVKRQMGTEFCKVNGEAITANGEKLKPQQISAFILKKLMRDAEAYLDEIVTDAVITVPAYFDDAQRQATKEAGQIAGLNVLRIINEPTAAGLAYHLEKAGGATILVFDLGGGTFDVSLLEVGERVVEVRATSGDNHLGGDDWDQRIVDWLVEIVKNAYGIDLSGDKVALQRLRETAEKTKIELSAATESQINLPYIASSEYGPLHLDAKLSRAEFQKMTADLLHRCRRPFRQVISDTGMNLSAIDHVVLVGGATRMPAVVDLVRDLTGGKEPNKGVNPDEVVAAGACLQAGVLKRYITNILLLDVTPLSLGIETVGRISDWSLTSGSRAMNLATDSSGVFTRLIERNTPIPAKRSKIFTTAEDSQPSVHIQVFQGERESTSGDKRLGQFDLPGIAPAPRGVPKIEVTFEIDANGILNVSAKDQATGRQQTVNITDRYASKREEIDRMAAVAERFANEDRKRREETEFRNRAEDLNQATEATLSENLATMPASLAADVRSAVAELKQALGGSDSDAIRTATENAAQVSLKMGTAIFAQTPQRTARKEITSPTRAEPQDIEVWPRSFPQWSENPEARVDNSLQVICRICGDRWDREAKGLPADLRKLRGPYQSPEEAEQAKAVHLRDSHVSSHSHLDLPTATISS